jgi:hypothetical protein
MCLTLGGVGIWYLYDLIVVAAGEFEDDEGRRLTRWDTAPSHPGENPGDERLAEDLKQLRAEVADLAERLDFAERLLAPPPSTDLTGSPGRRS